MEAQELPDEHDLLEILRSRTTSENSNEAEFSTELTALLTSAEHDEHPLYSLSTIHHAITNSGVSATLDALHVVPLLLDSVDPTAGEILAVLSECGNAKETVISVQESLEHLSRDLSADEGLEDGNIIRRLERSLLLYIGAIPRLKLHKKAASETLKPLFADLPAVIEHASSSLSKADGRNAILLLCRLLSCTISWASMQGDELDSLNVKAYCRDILCSGLVDLSPLLDTHLAQEKFESCFPRLVFGRKTVATSEDNSLVRTCVDVATELSCTLENLMHNHSTGALILFAYFLSCATSSIPPPNSIISSLSPILIATIQSSTGVDASLYILLSILFPSTNTSADLDPDLIPPLFYVLSPLASSSPDPQTRLIAFRTLGALLSRTPPLERMHLLRELLAESPFPALRVAAVGLLKDEVLAALGSHSSSASAGTGPSPFASPALLHTFGYVVLCPDPPDLFSRPNDLASLGAFLETHEPRRLVECLSFYYVLLMRDTGNLTGVRDASQIKSVNKEFLTPLRNALQAWAKLEDPEADEHATMALAALETSLERLDDAYEKLKEYV